MPQCLVLQPNGKYAIWSTIIDSFHVLNLAPEEILDVWMQRERRPLTERDEMQSRIDEEIKHIDEADTAWDWSNTWNNCVMMLERPHYDEHGRLTMIDKLGLPRRMKNKHSPYAREHYWHWYWHNKCELLMLRNGGAGR